MRTTGEWKRGLTQASAPSADALGKEVFNICLSCGERRRLLRAADRDLIRASDSRQRGSHAADGTTVPFLRETKGEAKRGSK